MTEQGRLGGQEGFGFGAGEGPIDETPEETAERRRRYNRGAVEAMLFVSDEPVTTARLSDMLGLSLGELDQILVELSVEYEEEERGVQLREVAGGWRLYTHPAYHDVIERYVQSWDTHKLSQAALEALAVIAYNQPTTRAIVSSIRGVNSDAVVSSLVEKGLVREAGRDTSSPGQPILYVTTRTFLEKFGLKSVKDLPPLEDYAANEETKQLIAERLSANSYEGIIDEDLEEDSDLDDDSISLTLADDEEPMEDAGGMEADASAAQDAGDAGGTADTAEDAVADSGPSTETADAGDSDPEA